MSLATIDPFEMRAKLERYIQRGQPVALTPLEARMFHTMLQHWMKNPPTLDDEEPPL